MKWARVFYVVVLIISVGIAFQFYRQYQTKKEESLRYQGESLRYQELLRLNKEAFEKAREEWTQTKASLEGELNLSMLEMKRLTKAIDTLEKDNLGFRSELQAMKDERALLQVKVGELTAAKNELERKMLSLEELKKAIKTAKLELDKKHKIEALQRYLAKVEELKKTDEIALNQGNRGYLFHDGKSTSSPVCNVKVELEVAAEDGR